MAGAAAGAAVKDDLAFADSNQERLPPAPCADEVAQRQKRCRLGHTARPFSRLAHVDEQGLSVAYQLSGLGRLDAAHTGCGW